MQGDEAGPKIDALGEFRLIDQLARILSPGGAVVGIGDDAAVIERTYGTYTLATVDMLVEGVHFPAGIPHPETVGRRALAASISDVAAMGGRPTHALISLAVDPDIPVATLEALYRGLRAEADLFGVGIVGGNVTRLDGPMCVDVTVLGEAPRDEVVLRSGARTGNLLAVTGMLGRAAALRLGAARGVPGFGEADRDFVPSPRIVEGRALASGRLVRAMMDLSDGLAGDIEHLCSSSSIGALLEASAIPLDPAVRELESRIGIDGVEVALSGGEDYELLMAIDPEHLESVRAAVAPTKLTVVGRTTARAESIRLRRNGALEPMQTRGWRHF